VPGFGLGGVGGGGGGGGKRKSGGAVQTPSHGVFPGLLWGELVRFLAGGEGSGTGAIGGDHEGFTKKKARGRGLTLIPAPSHFQHMSTLGGSYDLHSRGDSFRVFGYRGTQRYPLKLGAENVVKWYVRR